MEMQTVQGSQVVPLKHGPPMPCQVALWRPLCHGPLQQLTHPPSHGTIRRINHQQRIFWSFRNVTAATGKTVHHTCIRFHSRLPRPPPRPPHPVDS